MTLIAKKLPCEHHFCNWEGYIRTKCKNKKSDYYRKMLCPYHSSIEGEKKPKSKKRKRTEEENKVKSERRTEYFDYHIPLIHMSEESGIAIPNPSRMNVCHILPKTNFPSVDSLVENCVYLTGDEHTRIDNLIFSNRWEDVEKEFPNAWKLILERLNVVIPLVTENHSMLRNLKEYIKWEDEKDS